MDGGRTSSRMFLKYLMALSSVRTSQLGVDILVNSGDCYSLRRVALFGCLFKTWSCSAGAVKCRGWRSYLH